MESAAASGADLLVMPEFAAEHWLAFAPRDLSPRDEIPWLASHAEEALERLRPLPARHDIGLLAGTMPVSITRNGPGAPPAVNRAHLLLPDGRVVTQDKLCLTPVERNPQGWLLSTGKRISVVTWRDLRIVVLVCLDIELPILSARLAEHDVDLVLVPSMTETIAGYNRVFGCAKARATELLAAVGAVGCIGTVTTGNPRAACVSAAAMYLPCDAAIGASGVAAEIPPRDGSDDAGPMLVASGLPLARLRALRSSGAEVWPGAWSGGHVDIVEA